MGTHDLWWLYRKHGVNVVRLIKVYGNESPLTAVSLLLLDDRVGEYDYSMYSTLYLLTQRET